MPAPSRAPIIGITCDVTDRDATQRRTYDSAVIAAGGVPILIPPPALTNTSSALDQLRDLARAHIDLLDALILTGGRDPDLTPFGKPNHPASTLLHPDRQAYELALLAELDHRRALPTLGICLGMQLMALHAGGDLDPHLPDSTLTADDHTNDHHHSITPVTAHPLIIRGTAASWHHQAVRDPGRLRLVARAHDNVIEAVDDPARPFYLGVQWHPERTADPNLGEHLFRALIAAARSASSLDG